MTSAERAAELFERLDTPGFACVVREERELAKADDIKEISKAIDAAVAEALAARWVPVVERLPEVGVYVLASVSEPDCVTDMCITRILSGSWACERTGYTVLAWQPLPAAWVAP